MRAWAQFNKHFVLLKLKIGPFPASFFFIFVSPEQFIIQLIVNRICPCMDSNRGSLVPEAIALRTEPQPLPKLSCVSLSCPCFKFFDRHMQFGCWTIEMFYTFLLQFQNTSTYSCSTGTKTECPRCLLVISASKWTYGFKRFMCMCLSECYMWLSAKLGVCERALQKVT